MGNPLLINLSFLLRQPTGISTYAVNLFPQLRSLDPTLLAPTSIESFQCYAVPGHMTAEQGTKGHLQRLLWTQFELPKIYQNLNASLLFSPVPEAPLYSNCRYIVTIHDLIALRFPGKFSPLTLYTRYSVPAVVKQAEHILCNSTATAQDVIRYFGVDETKVTPILLAHDANHFRHLNLPTQNYFLYIGRLDPYKNIQRLISAFAMLPDLPNYELWLAGPPDRRYQPLLEAQIAHLGLTPQVKFLNYVPYEELPKLLNQAIGLVFPTLWEGFGLPVLEAMACGTPVITSNLASLPEVTGNAAILVDPYKVSEIADAMQALANDAYLRAKLRTAGLDRASQFSWEKTGRETVKVLQQYL